MTTTTEGPELTTGVAGSNPAVLTTNQSARSDCVSASPKRDGFGTPDVDEVPGLSPPRQGELTEG